MSDIQIPKAIEELRNLKRTTTGAATFLVKVNAHRAGPANEEANIQADKAVSSKDVATVVSRVRVVVCLGVRVCVCVCQRCTKHIQRRRRLGLAVAGNT